MLRKGENISKSLGKKCYLQLNHFNSVTLIIYQKLQPGGSSIRVIYLLESLLMAS